MTNMEALTNMVNSENAPVIAGIGGIVLLVGIDRMTKGRYRIEGKKDSITIEPAAAAAAPPEQAQEEEKNA